MLLILVCLCLLTAGSPSLCPQPATPIAAANLTRFRWLHFPKAGTSFATTLYHYSCRGLPPDAVPSLGPTKKGLALSSFEKRYNFEKHCKGKQFRHPRTGHQPLTKHEVNLNAETPMIVTMIRDPRTRLWSAYNVGMHSVGMSSALRKQMLASVKTARQYAQWPGIASCQTKMILGHNCAAKFTITEDLFQTAVARLRTFAFVGLTDDWDTSICLFHAMYGGALKQVFFHNVRNTSEAVGHHDYQQAAYGNQLDVTDDPYDWRLYLEAVHMYLTKLRAYGLQTSYAVPGLGSLADMTTLTKSDKQLKKTKMKIAALQASFKKQSRDFDTVEAAALRTIKRPEV